MFQTSKDSIALRRMFRRALESRDQKLLDECLAELRSRLQTAPETAASLAPLLKQLLEKSVKEKDLTLLNQLLAMKPLAEWLAAACLSAGKDGWIEGYHQLRLQAERPSGITLTDAFILGESVDAVRTDRTPKQIKVEVENLLAHARKTPGATSSACKFLEGLGLRQEGLEALQT
jgi:hypothetical protein